MICPHCGSQNKDDTRYCKSCGTRLASAAHLLCRNCGFSNSEDNTFCTKCGQRLTTGNAQPASSSNATTPETRIASKPHEGSPNNPSSYVEITPKSVPPVLDTGSPETPSDTSMMSSQSIHSKKTSMPSKTDQQPINAEQDEEWIRRISAVSSSKTGLVPTHELIRVANALGIDIDYSTLRFWQKRGLVPKPMRGPVSSGRGTRGYYNASLIDRISFIRKIQKLYSLGLDTIRDELDRIDRQNAHVSDGHSSKPYLERLEELQQQYEGESKKTLVAVLSKALGLDPDDIATVVIRKKDGQTIRFAPGMGSSDLER